MDSNQLSIDDPALFLRIAQGNETALRVLYHAFYPRLRYFCYDLTGNEAEAQDMAQEALAVFWQRREGFKAATLKEVSAFLFMVARNKCYDYHKHAQVKMAKQQQIVYDMETIEDVMESRIVKEDLFNLIYKELQQLPAAQVQLLKMIFVEGLDTQEIAERLSITPNNVRNQKARALEKLKAILLKKRLFIFLSIFY